MKKIKKVLTFLIEIAFFVFTLSAFCYSGYKVAEHYGLIKSKVFGAESCSECSSCSGSGWVSELCQKIREWCERGCPCQPTPTRVVPTPTPAEPTPTVPEPTPTIPEPTPTLLTPTPTCVHTDGGIGGTSGGGDSGGGGGGGGGNPGPCVPPEAPKAPSLLSAAAVSGREVKLTWTKVDRATHYAVAYGVSSGNYIYGNANVGNADSYTVGGLQTGKTYYFVVSAAIGGDCPVASPYSNELSNRVSGAGQGILGVNTDPLSGTPTPAGELDGGVSTSVGEVAGTEKGKACPYWWYVLVGQTIFLSGFYGFLLKKKQLPRRWWLAVPGLVLAAYLVDRYAHTHWFIPSRMCPWEKWISAGLAILETAGFKKLRKT